MIWCMDTPVRDTQSLYAAINGEGVGDMAIVEPVARGTHLQTKQQPINQRTIHELAERKLQKDTTASLCEAIHGPVNWMLSYQDGPVVGMTALLLSGRLHAPQNDQQHCCRL